jgi:hypothetical protein
MSRYVGVVSLYWKGKGYGGTSRMVYAKSDKEARNKLKKTFEWKEGKIVNKVKINKLYKY